MYCTPVQPTSVNRVVGSAHETTCWRSQHQSWCPGVPRSGCPLEWLHGTPAHKQAAQGRQECKVCGIRPKCENYLVMGFTMGISRSEVNEPKVNKGKQSPQSTQTREVVAWDVGVTCNFLLVWYPKHGLLTWHFGEECNPMFRGFKMEGPEMRYPGQQEALDIGVQFPILFGFHSSWNTMKMNILWWV